MPRFPTPSFSTLRIAIPLCLLVVLPGGGCQFSSLLFTNGARFEADSEVFTEFGQFATYIYTPRLITDVERQAGARQQPTRYYVRIGRNYLLCGEQSSHCKAVVAAHFRANPPVKLDRRNLPEPEGGFDRTDGGYALPSHPDPQPEPEPEPEDET